ncbi:hypothetical protein KC887_00235 [Candidatus Kaiserbacteria bacterium]|nr:hypothetical protein [Candidatus Kaiserbacteria bacterium]
MNAQELHDAIFADPTAAQLADAGNDLGCASRMVAILPPIPRPGSMLGEQGLFGVLTVEEAEVFLQTVESLSISPLPEHAVFKRVLRWLQSDLGMEFGNATVHAMLHAMQGVGPGKISQATVDKLIAFSSQPQTVSPAQVSEAWSRYRPGGIISG